MICNKRMRKMKRGICAQKDSLPLVYIRSKNDIKHISNITNTNEIQRSHTIIKQYKKKKKL